MKGTIAYCAEVLHISKCPVFLLLGEGELGMYKVSAIL